jgi:hypothetical protein
MIYHFVLSGHYMSLDVKAGSKESNQRMKCCAGTNSGHDLQNLLALPSVCRQIHAESHEIIFITNEFGGCTWLKTEDFIIRFAPHQQAIIQSVRLRYCHFACHAQYIDNVSFDKLQSLRNVVFMADWERPSG